MFIPLQLFAWFALVICLAAEFKPKRDDYNAYGSKVAANNLMIVQADNQYFKFYILFGNSTDNITANYDRLCTPDYPDYSQDGYPRSSFYVYTVAVGKSSLATPNIFFVGAMTDRDDLDNGTQPPNPTFVGVLSYKGSLTEIDCNVSNFDFQVHDIWEDHYEQLVLVTDPRSTIAYGFSNDFTFSYVASTNNLTVHPENSFSPSVPFAADYDGNHGIIAGLLTNNRNGRITYMVTIILFSIDTSTAIATQNDTWTYPSNDSTWQAEFTFPGAEEYNPKYDMSVSINLEATQVLVGIQVINSVFLFNYTNDKLTFVTLISPGRGVGFGKGIVWLRDSTNSIAILSNVLSSSRIYIYDSPLTNASTSVSVFPNNQQLLYRYMSSVIINIVTTPDHLVFHDDLGNFFIILSAPAGYYSTTTGPSFPAWVAFSSQSQCIEGTYKNVSGIRPCRPCPTGTKNDGTNATCVNCTANVFCPLGSMTNSISNDETSNVIQVLAYPESPDITGLDDILFFTLFSIGSTGRCIALSPMFWTLIVAAIVILVTVVMVIIKYSVKNKKATRSYEIFRKVFQRTDIIREGDMWPSGLATFCVAVLCIACCVFSAKYYASYPIETVGPSTYTCDTTIRNAQFSTSLRPLSIPVSDELQKMIDLLNDQKPNLTVSFINTIANCSLSDLAELNYQLGSTWQPVLPTPTCAASNYIVTYDATLPFRLITLRYTLPYRNMIGGLRIGLNAPGKSKSSTITLQDLGFSLILNQSERTLGQTPYITLQLTKVINK